MKARSHLSIGIPDALIPWIVLAAITATLAGALLFQYAGGLAPCPLCLEQRLPYWIAAPLCLMAGAAARGNPGGPWNARLMIIAAMLFTWGAGLALYHVGVEWRWWPGPTACNAASGGAPADTRALRALLDSGSIPRCDEIPWSLFGLSLAGYNVLISTALALVSAWPMARRIRHAQKPAKGNP